MNTNILKTVGGFFGKAAASKIMGDVKTYGFAVASAAAILAIGYGLLVQHSNKALVSKNATLVAAVSVLEKDNGNLAATNKVNVAAGDRMYFTTEDLVKKQAAIQVKAVKRDSSIHQKYDVLIETAVTPEAKAVFETQRDYELSLARLNEAWETFCTKNEQASISDCKANLAASEAK